MTKRAFTLVEMLIVIVIIGILAAALIPRLTGIQSRARDTARDTGLSSVSQALELYSVDENGQYPAGQGSTAAGSTLSGAIVYMDGGFPDNSASGLDASDTNCEGSDGTYAYSGTATSYVLTVAMETPAAGNASDCAGTDASGATNTQHQSTDTYYKARKRGM